MNTTDTTQHVLVKYYADWADEMYIYGFHLFENVTEYNGWIDYARGCFPWTHGVGSNESIEYHTFNDFQSTLTTSFVTADEAAVIIKYLGKRWGNFPEPEESDDV